MSSVRGRGGIFISYRREETAAQAGRLYDRLSDRFGEERVFMDVEAIAIGVDFTKAVMEAVSECDILLALIGRDWPAITDSKGKRRIDNPHDFIRIEIETALERDIRVVPVLVDGAVLPHADDLPPTLQPLIGRQALELSHTGFRSEVARLVAAVDELLEDQSGRSAGTPKTPSREGKQSPQATESPRGSRWTAELLASTPSTRTLRISLNYSHILTVRLKGVYANAYYVPDTVHLDNRVILRKWPLGGSYSFEIDDGGTRLKTDISVAPTFTGKILKRRRSLAKLSLTVMGQCLYSE
jgi:hypothetical protein